MRPKGGRTDHSGIAAFVVLVGPTLAIEQAALGARWQEVAGGEQEWRRVGLEIDMPGERGKA